MKSEFKKRHIFWIVILLIIAVFVFRKGLARYGQSLALRTISPSIKVTSGATRGTREVVTSFLRIGTLSRSVRILENKNSGLEAQLAQLESLKNENNDLRKQLELLPKKKYSIVTADVIGHSSDGARDVLIINRGLKDGIREEMPVIVNEGVVVGKIDKADEFTSALVLVTDVEFRLAAAIVGTSAQGLVRGARGLDVIIEDIPRDISISIGDKVVTTGLDGIFPPDLLIGTIRTVQAPGNEIFQSASLSPTVDPRKLRMVGVIINNSTQ